MDDEVMLTTIDNPYNPFLQFDDWLAFDEEKGYFTCEYLARMAFISDGLTDDEKSSVIKQAIDDICKLNILGIYKKVYKNSKI